MKFFYVGPGIQIFYIVLLLPDVFLRTGSVALAVLSGSSDRQRPAFRLKFEVNYNTTDHNSSYPGLTGEYAVSHSCGEYYATKLLTNFVQLNNWLGTLCTDSIVVRIDRRAVVFIMGREVKVETNVNLSLPRHNASGGNNSGGGSSVAIVNCSKTLVETLMNVTSLDRRLMAETQAQNQNKTRLISSIEGTGECLPVTMDPTRFQLRNSSWICDDNYHYNRDRWECYRAGTTYRFSTTFVNGWATIERQQRQTTSPSSSAVYMTASSHLDNHVSDGFPASVFPVTSPPETTIDLDFEQPKFWGIEPLREISRIHLTEGEKVFVLPLRLWYNHTVLCLDEPTCDISMAATVVANEEHPELECRRTGRNIPQVAFIQTREMPWSSEKNFCRFHFPPNQTTINNTHLLLKALIDHKYDGWQTRSLRLSLIKKTATAEEKETLFEIPVVIEDTDKKATCQSINDPHITTFDGREYNNFYEGEFILYRHQTLPFRVHAIYQKCQLNLPASCNCGVAVQSGDDVIVIDRCLRQRLAVPEYRRRWSSESGSTMKVQMYLNGNLTQGTKIHEDADGKKYFIYLPHGAYIKIITSGQLVNLWIVPSPMDLYMTRGLCGTYDWNRANDFHLRNGTVSDEPEEVDDIERGGRPQPASFISEWSVDLETEESLFEGVPPAFESYEPKRFCICENGEESAAVCDYAADVSRCDVYQGRDVTSFLVSHAISGSIHPSRRFQRDINDNSVLEKEPVVLSKQFVPPGKYKWKNSWNDVIATNFCRNHIKDKYTVGQLCSQIPPVNFKQEITTCVEDIKITGNTSWADSARDAMKEQCIEEVQKNGSLSSDIVRRISSEMCINDCSNNGVCRNGTCHCNADYASADCSTLLRSPPNVNEVPKYGLCDLRYMTCDRTIIYGQNFIDSINLTCHLQKCKLTDHGCKSFGGIEREPAIFINFNAVECPIPAIHVYWIRISNNGVNTSKELLYVPFDSVCNSCNVFNTTCAKKRNSCIIDGRCYSEGEVSPSNQCLVCKSYDDEFQWATITDNSCYRAWWETFHLPDWAVGLGAAVGGSLIGVLTGFLLYRCCCRSSKLPSDEDIATDGHMDVGDFSGFETDSFLHRSHRIPTYNGGSFGDLDPYDPGVQEPTSSVFYNDGKGVENGVDSTTYF